MSKKKGEEVMKPNKEQKGNHSVLVIAVGKHPKVGPGERKSKGLKKAEQSRKSKSQMRREKRAAKNAKREGTPEERKEASVKNTATAQQSRHNKKYNSKEIDESSLGDLASKFSLQPRGKRGSKEGADHPTGMSRGMREALARKLGVNRSDIREDSPMLHDRKEDLFNAMREMGAEHHARRKSTGESRTKDWKDRKESREVMRGTKGDHIYQTTGHSEASIRRLALARGISMEQVIDMMEGRPATNEDELDRHGNPIGEGESDMRGEPSTVSTTPFPQREGEGLKQGAKRQIEEGSGRGGYSNIKPNTSVEGTLHGFKAPLNSGTARVGDVPGYDDDESPNYDEVQDRMTELQTGEPMNLAFRLLKNSMCKGGDCDGCDKCNCKGGDKCKCSKCC